MTDRLRHEFDALSRRVPGAVRTDGPRPMLSRLARRRRRARQRGVLLAAAAALVLPAAVAGASLVSEVAPDAPVAAPAAPVAPPPPPTATTTGGPVPDATGATAGPPPPRSPEAPPGPGPAGGTEIEVAVYLLERATGAQGCSRLVEVTRRIGSEDPVRGALEAVLAGPTAEESRRGLWSVWGEGGVPTPATVTVDPDQTFVMVDVASLSDIDTATSTACRHNEIRWPVIRTLEQFGPDWNAGFRAGGSNERLRAYIDDGGPA
ncbi:MAG: hypothetical protein ACFCVG_16075 [Kineosporiaceae bacterium]